MSEIIHNTDGTIVCRKNLSEVSHIPMTNWEGVGFLTGLLAIIFGLVIAAISFPWFVTVGLAVIAGISFWKTADAIDYYQRVGIFLKNNSFPISCKSSNVALKIMRMKKGKLVLGSGIYRSDYKPSEVEPKGSRYHPSGINLSEMDYEYDCELVLNKTKKGLVFEQHFIPRPVTMWDQALKESRALHKL